MYLVKNGVPFDIAFSLDQVYLAAFCITFGELDGNTFDFRSMSFTSPEKMK